MSLKAQFQAKKEAKKAAAEAVMSQPMATNPQVVFFNKLFKHLYDVMLGEKEADLVMWRQYVTLMTTVWRVLKLVGKTEDFARLERVFNRVEYGIPVPIGDRRFTYEFSRSMLDRALLEPMKIWKQAEDEISIYAIVNKHKWNGFGTDGCGIRYR
jgi:hypothetical protein